MIAARIQKRPLERLSRPFEAILLFALLVAVASPAAGIPAFARKYQTSCQTCHIAFPKLNNFGEAFRMLGYHLPGETESQIKEPEVPLGAPAYKRVWPNAVWPGAIPGSVPLSVAANFLVTDSSQVEGEEGGDGGEMRMRTKLDFAFPEEAELITAGSAGEHLSFFGEIAFEREVEDGEVQSDVGVEHLDVRFIRPIKNSTAFNFKIGTFQPELVSTFDHARRLTIANYDSMFGVSTLNAGGAESVGGGHHGGQGLALPVVATGIELFGVAHHRFLWSAGVVNGLGPGEETFDGNSTKDVYGRIAYKWGGLAPDGSNAASFAGSDKNWREKSFRLGVFGYDGDGSGVLASVEEEHHAGHSLLAPDVLFDAQVEPAFVEDSSFSRVGLDFNVFYQDLNLFGAYVEGNDDLRSFGVDDASDPIPGALETFTYRAWFVEGDLVLRFPWLHGALRYETVDLPKHEDGEKVPNFERATLSLTGLVRANAKITLEYTWDLNEPKNYSTWLNFGIVF